MVPAIGCESHLMDGAELEQELFQHQPTGSCGQGCTEALFVHGVPGCMLGCHSLPALFTFLPQASRIIAVDMPLPSCLLFGFISFVRPQCYLSVTCNLLQLLQLRLHLFLSSEVIFACKWL